MAAELSYPVSSGASAAEKLAARMLAHTGIAAIWDTHVAAAAAYGLGNQEMAGELTEIAEAAERLRLNARQLDLKRRA